ncbi:MAG: hypothetical protein ACWA40_03030, partial [Planktomarina sp.]
KGSATTHRLNDVLHLVSSYGMNKAQSDLGSYFLEKSGIRWRGNIGLLLLRAFPCPICLASDRNR